MTACYLTTKLTAFMVGIVVLAGGIAGCGDDGAEQSAAAEKPATAKKSAAKSSSPSVEPECKYAPRCPGDEELAALLRQVADIRDAGLRGDSAGVCVHMSQTTITNFYEPDGLNCEQGVTRALKQEGMPRGDFTRVSFQGHDDFMESFLYNDGGYIRMEMTATSGGWKLFAWVLDKNSH